MFKIWKEYVAESLDQGVEPGLYDFFRYYLPIVMEQQVLDNACERSGHEGLLEGRDAEDVVGVVEIVCLNCGFIR